MTTDSTAAGPSSPAAVPSPHQARQFEDGVGCACGKPWPHTDARLRELEKAATPGPWRVGAIEPTAIVVGDAWRGQVLARLDLTNQGSVGFTEADRTLIAESRNALPLLLDVADAARAYHQARRTGSAYSELEWERLVAKLADLDAER